MNHSIDDALSSEGEHDWIDFKREFDPGSAAAWCEVVKDVVAMANSGGGFIVIGLEDDGTPSGSDIQAALAVDPAVVADKIRKYTGVQFASFSLHRRQRSGVEVQVVEVGPVQYPVVFTNAGTYELPDKKQGRAFSVGQVYFRHGAKSGGGKWGVVPISEIHVGDPDQDGRFGIYDCMGRVRNYAFDAVIGIGGVGLEPKSFGIDRKINWVGINPKRRPSPGGKGVDVTFEKFLRLEEHGPLLETLAPSLARRMYEGGARILLKNYSDLEHREATAILQWSLNQTSRKIGGSKNAQGCQSRCRPAAKTRGPC